MNGAQLLCDTLLENGIDVCFANPGTSEMHFVAALDERPAMRCILGLFEGVVTGAADGYARMAGKPAVTLLHLGSGLSNGLANLHNANRAKTPMVNIVGDHARHHLQFDAPLTSDIKKIGSAVSSFIRTAETPELFMRDIVASIKHAIEAPGGVSTLILPADIAWSPVPPTSLAAKVEPPASRVVEETNIQSAAAALRSGRALLLLGGPALRSEPLQLAHSVAKAMQASILAETSNARMERGAGVVPIAKLPYVVDAALDCLKDIDQLILVGAREPVAFFAYPGKPSRLITEDCSVVTLAANQDNIVDALERLLAALEIETLAEVPTLMAPILPDSTDDALNAAELCRAIAALLPENAIVTDESITQGRTFFNDSYGAAFHDYLQLTGGAIGIGLPLATGAAVACPQRQVVALQADGSAMYTVQALWTQAREKLKCITVIFSNRRYAILQQEMSNVGVTKLGPNAHSMLTIGTPDINWVQLSESMGVNAARAETMRDFIEAFEIALKHEGPYLIEAVLP